MGMEGERRHFGGGGGGSSADFYAQVFRKQLHTT